MLLWDSQPAVAIGVAYKDKKPFYGFQYFRAQEKVNIELNLSSVTYSALTENLAEFNRSYRNENSIFLDLAYQNAFYKEKKRQERLARERAFIGQLKVKAFPCDCGDKEEFTKSASQFRHNCTACHALTDIVVGPALKGISKRRDMEWIVKFVQNSAKVIASGDPYSMELFYRYYQTEMKSFP